MLTEQVIFLEQDKFTGKLDVKSITGARWTLHFLFGRIFWGDGGEQPNRFWKKSLIRYNLTKNQYNQFFCSKKQSSYSNHHLLTQLLEQKKISLEELRVLVKQQIQRILFEIFQFETTQVLSYSTVSQSGNSILSYCGLKISLIRLNTEEELAITKQKWQNWCDRGLTEISPNLAPSLKNSKRLKTKVSSQVYHNFVKLIDGKRSLQELAIELQRDVLELTYSLKPYIAEGSIELIQISDLSFKEIINLCDAAIDIWHDRTLADRTPLIACIDDSPAIIHILEKIIRYQGYNFIGIQDPLRATTQLIISNPDLIFLDISMPIVNGYELCAQLNRVTKFKETPIIMLTSRDGIAERLRARMSGASAFLSKPINLVEITQTIEKFLGNSTKVVFTTKINFGQPKIAKILSLS